MNIPILYEDKFLIAIDKPSGIIVNRAESVKSETVQDWVEEKLKIKNLSQRLISLWLKKSKIKDGTDFISRAGIVHRLDKDTSGILLIAKTQETFLNLQNQFKERSVKKKYLTLVHGLLTPVEGEISASVGRLPWNRERFGILPGGRPAVTSYEVINKFKTDWGDFSELLVYPHTGRTHQIRIHLKYTGHPVVSDNFYAGRKTVRKDLKFCPRLFLHAAYLSFKHPFKGDMIEIESPLPDDLKRVLDKFASLND